MTLKRLTLALALLAAPVLAQPGVVASPRWKPPVANLAALPATGNTIGDTRIALDTMVHYTWDGDSWETAASGGGAGTVTSVALAVPAEWTVSGSPITGAGTITIGEATQAANTVYAGPTTGAAAAPGFRALDSADVPNNAADTTGNAATATALAANGANCPAGQYPLGVDASGAAESCTADDTGTDDQTATEVAYTPTTGTDWTDPDPTSAGEGLDDLAARLAIEEAKADDDVPESGDFGAATDLDADGSVSADSVDLGTDTTGNYVSSATASQGLTLTGTEGASLGLQDCAATEVLKRNAGDTAWECAADATGSGIGGSTGATDNAILRADGTGGSTAQSSAATINDAGYLQTALFYDTGNTFNLSSLVGGLKLIATSAVVWSSNAATNGPSDTSIVRNGAAATVRIANGSSGIGYLNTARSVEANTAGSGTPNALTATESWKVLTNEGATAANYHTLPTAVAGYVFTFVVQDADGLRVTASTGDTIRIAATVSSSGGYCESTTIGDSITLVAINATEWVATSYVGSGFSCALLFFFPFGLRRRLDSLRAANDNARALEEAA